MTGRIEGEPEGGGVSGTEGCFGGSGAREGGAEARRLGVRKLLVAVVGILVVAVFVVAYLGVMQVPVLSSLLGMDRPRNLGVVADTAAYQAMHAKYNFQRPSDPTNYGMGNKHEWSGGVEFDEDVSQEIVAAIPEVQNGSDQFKDIQIRFHPGQAEVSMFANNPGGYPLSGPVYGIFALERTGEKSVSVRIDKLEFGRIGVPGDVLSQAQAALQDYLNARLADMPNLRIDELQLMEGKVHLKGLIPQVVSAGGKSGNGLP